MFCGSCGKQIPEGSGFCPACGAAAGGGAPRPGATAGAAAGPSAAAAQRAKLEAQFKAGSQDAIAAVKVLLTDPVGGLAKSFSMFDAARAQIVGIIFGVLFVIMEMITALTGGMGMFTGGFGGGFGGISLPFSYYVKIFFILLIQVAGLIIGCFATRMMFRGAGSLASDIYISGACLLPLGLALLIGSLLANAAGALLFVAVMFGFSYCILMLYAGAMNIGKISEGKAALSAPLSLGIMGVVMYIAMRVILM